MLLSGQGHQSVVHGTSGNAQAAQSGVDIWAAWPLSVSGAVNRASSKRAASGAESLASPGNLVSTE